MRQTAAAGQGVFYGIGFAPFFFNTDPKTPHF
jgi:hypothetical protein